MNTKFAIDFIPSKDEIDYLKARDYNPSLVQAAFFIVSSFSKVPFEKQEEALLKLKETNEDEPYKDTTVFEMIDDYLKESHICLRTLEDRKDTTYYTFSYKNDISSSRSFNTLESCKDAALKEFDSPYNENDLEFVRIEKYDFIDKNYYNSAVFGKDENGDLQYFHMRNYEPLLMICTDDSIPHPFRVGDVVKSASGIAVLYELPCEANKYIGKLLVPEQNQNTALTDFVGDMFTFEYGNELSGKYKILEPIGKYLRGEIYIDEMLQLYEKARQEELCKAPYYSYFA